jgi:hypothetical protein
VIKETNKKYFYCYDINLFKFLKQTKNLNYICTGLNENTLKKFWQFERTENLDMYLHEYKNIINNTNK